ncbi:MAG: transcription-repair coupling factor [Deltaproteobacteria bacterium]|nr:transcription-repair coupling factor [Deltaproteobacteria bacterium]
MPARIELDGDLVASIKLFDPDDQRTLRSVDELFVHPARESLLGERERQTARTRLLELADRLELPSTQTRRLVDEVESGRLVLGADGYLPAFYDGLESLFAYLPDDRIAVIVDPERVAHAARDELGHAIADRGARVAKKEPAFELADLYLDEAAIAQELEPRDGRRSVLVAHALAVAGEPEEREGPLDAWVTVPGESVHGSASTDGLGDSPSNRPSPGPSPRSEQERPVPEGAALSRSGIGLLRFGGEPLDALVAELRAHRHTAGKQDALRPIARVANQWLESGFRVVFVAHATTQAERLAAILKSYEVKVRARLVAFDARAAGPPLSARPAADRALRFEPGTAEIVVGRLGSGFVLASEGIACVAEEEVFGGRSQRGQGRARKTRDRTRAFLEDLRALAVGDYVVHVEHGIGRYLGLEKKVVPLSKADELRGLRPLAVEVLVVEYAGGDRLFLPVYRLNQIQKYSGSEAKPKLDKLGGQTFARTKERVAAEVRQMADELLKLYAERAAKSRPALAPADRTYAEFEASFPFEETPDQARAIDDVMHDLEKPVPMDRLVCGDVGFGKTEAALRAAFRVAMAGRQVAVLCPTTVLAQQHYRSFCDRMTDYPVEIAVLSRFVPKPEQSATLARVKEGKVDVLIGTHRLLSKDVHFKQLGLVVVDEEQRFGVAHKERLKQLRTEVDVLTLSATPIPRTLQMAVTGMRDLSLITTPPADRRAIRTIVTRWDELLVREAVLRELSRGGQVFYVHNRVDAIYERAERLQRLVPDAKIAVAHGQMAEGALENAMLDFVDGRFDVLVSTAIIESGLDIPRANTMIVDRADLFGLSQLYQLRGRVGRSKERAYCYLVVPPPNQMSDDARERIVALERFTELGSGFQIASLDMELRGAGEILGAEQSGEVSAVGLDMFVHMLEDAVSALRGETVVHEVDPELTFEVPLLLPDDYVNDVGVRLSLYKRFAGALDEDEVADLAREMEDRFGSPPDEARAFVRAMALKTELRRMRIVGLEASRERVVLHLRADTPLDPKKVMALVGAKGSPWRLSPDMKLTRRTGETSGLDGADRAMRELAPLVQAS